MIEAKTGREVAAEAVQSPTMTFVTTKTVEQLDLQALHRVRDRPVGQRTGLINQIRAFLLERGIAVRQRLRLSAGGTAHYSGHAQQGPLSSRMLRLLEDHAGDWRRLDQRIENLSDEIAALARQDQTQSEQNESALPQIADMEMG